MLVGNSVNRIFFDSWVLAKLNNAFFFTDISFCCTDKYVLLLFMHVQCIVYLSKEVFKLCIVNEEYVFFFSLRVFKCNLKIEKVDPWTEMTQFLFYPFSNLLL